MTIHLTGLVVYPIKSARGIPLRESEVDDFGLCRDRRWMVVDHSGQFITQRSDPRMALVQPSLNGEVLRVDAPGMPRLEVLPLGSAAETMMVRVWNDVCQASSVGQEAASWFSEYLGCPCFLVHMEPSTIRPADPEFAPAGTRVSFADSFPFLLISEESLADLNRRLRDPLPMNRFRPNLVVAGGEPYGEDTWKRIQVGGISMRVVKPCGRCVVTTTDQITGERGREPLRTLATYRKREGEVMFGQNVVHQAVGVLRVGDVVQVEAWKSRSSA
jgi:uncharacterized protein YcbX